MKINNKSFKILPLINTLLCAIAIVSFQPLAASDDNDIADVSVTPSGGVDTVPPSDKTNENEDKDSSEESEVTIKISSTGAVDVEFTIKLPKDQPSEIFLVKAIAVTKTATSSLYEIQSTTNPIAISEQITIAKEALEKLVTSLSTIASESKNENWEPFHNQFSVFLENSFADERCSAFLEELDTAQSENERRGIIKDFISPIFSALKEFGELLIKIHGDPTLSNNDVYA